MDEKGYGPFLAADIARAVRARGGRALVVGGWVRDRLLKSASADRSAVAQNDLASFGETRRSLGEGGTAEVAAARAAQAGGGATGSMINGVRIGAQTYSFRALPRPAEGDMSDALVAAFTECGLRECELWSPQIEPAKVPREELRRWRIETPLSHFTGLRKKFNSANIMIRAFNYSFNDSFT